MSRLGLAMLLGVMLAGLVLASASETFLEQDAAHMVETTLWSLAASTVVEEARRFSILRLLALAFSF